MLREPRQVRIQVDLEEGLHARLREIERERKCTISQLVREALAQAYGTAPTEERLATLRAVEGLWRDRTDLTSARRYVDRLRGRGSRRPLR